MNRTDDKKIKIKMVNSVRKLMAFSDSRDKKGESQASVRRGKGLKKKLGGVPVLREPHFTSEKLQGNTVQYLSHCHREARRARTKGARRPGTGARFSRG